MSSVKYFVEVTVRVEAGTSVIKREPSESWPSCLGMAQKMAMQMFREDPMTSRVFRNGIMAYTNTNDFGDPVLIRPIAVMDEEVLSYDPRTGVA